MNNVISRVLSRVANAWQPKSEDDFSIARGMEPAFTNRALATYIAPVALFSLIAKVVPEDHFDAAIVALAVWYIGGAAILLGLAVRWFLRAVGHARLNLELSSTRTRLAEALANTHRSNPGYFSILDWRERVVASKSGDVTIARTVKLLVGPERAHVIRSSINSYGPPVPASEIGVEVIERIANGGTRRVDFDPFWTEVDGGVTGCSVNIYFPDGATPDSERTLEIKWSWPKFLKRLVEDEREEEISYQLGRRCDRLSYQLTLPSRRNREIVAEDEQHAVVTTRRDARKETIEITGTGLSQGDVVFCKLIPTRIKK